ncbi:hypothetical protein Tco_1554914 [Tanacetum coccineum]
MSGSQDEIPPPPPSSQTPTQQTPHTVSTIKLPILKKGDITIRDMINTRYQIKVLPSNDAEEILAEKEKEKHQDHFAYGFTRKIILRNFINMSDAKRDVGISIKLDFCGK